MFLPRIFDFFFSKKGLYLGETIPQLFSMPTSLEFARDYVAKNLPVVIRGATEHWPACTKWNSKYFRYLKSNANE